TYGSMGGARNLFSLYPIVLVAKSKLSLTKCANLHVYQRTDILKTYFEEIRTSLLFKNIIRLSQTAFWKTGVVILE
ncbi:MAG: hypothetical protein ACLRNP_22860, partial [Blautia coccoides]